MSNHFREPASRSLNVTLTPKDQSILCIALSKDCKFQIFPYTCYYWKVKRRLKGSPGLVTVINRQLSQLFHDCSLEFHNYLIIVPKSIVDRDS